MFWSRSTGLAASRQGVGHRGRALLSVLATVGGMVPALALATVVVAPGAVAGPAPAAVKDISGDSLTSGTLFGGRQEALAVNPVNQQIVLAAAEFGGLWR